MKCHAEIIKTFSQKLRQYRKAYNLSQEQLAANIMYSGKAVSKWERGEVLPPATALIAIADYFNISLDELLGYYEAPSFYLGIDGGGSKTTFSLADEKGVVIKTIKLGSSNPVDLGFERAEAVLDEGIRQITNGISRRKISMFAGIAGGGLSEVKARLATFFEKYGFVEFSNDSDAANVIAAGLDKQDGMIVIMGTGSSAFVQKDGQVERIGGLGYLFDHGGCAYDRAEVF